jgi:small nuclear ribonucleoprotein (snRNP)-like protein
MSHTHNLLRAGLVLLAVFYSFPGHAAKTDVVTLINGNAITGEIKVLDFGALRYSTDSMGTVSIDWEDIVGITSDQNLQIELTNGTKYFGKLRTSDDEFSIRVRTASAEVDLRTQQVVRITPIDEQEKFWQNLDGSFSLGLQTQKSSEVTTSNFNLDVYRRARTYLVGLKMNSAITDQPSEETKAQQSVEVNYQRFRGNRWFTDWFTRWEKNDEQGISGRNSAGGAFGRYVLQTNRNLLSISMGVQAARTSFRGEEESGTEAEGRFEVRYLRRRLVPEVSMTFTTKIYPLLNDFSQYRAETDLSFKREFFDDLFLDLTIGHSYLSNPPEDIGASKVDYNITTSLGYSF